jgi:hypothetical protein
LDHRRYEKGLEQSFSAKVEKYNFYTTYEVLLMSKKNVLDGIKVIEVASFVAGPSASVQLADFGAEVLKVEPLSGDPWRNGDKNPPLVASETHYCHMLANRNKKSVALNLKDPKAQEVLYKLVAEADIFLTNSLPHVIKDLNISYDTLKKSIQKSFMHSSPDLVNKAPKQILRVLMKPPGGQIQD